MDGKSIKKEWCKMVNKNLFVSAKTSLDESIEQAEIILEALQKMVVENDIAEVLQQINRSYSSVEQMKKDESLIEGQLLTVTGYYEGDTLSTHQRVVSKTDNGFGELLDNGLYANLLYQDNEINITHIGARNSYNTEKKIYDILPYVKKISDKGQTIYLPNGWWGISYFNFAKNSFKMKGCCTVPYFSGLTPIDNVISSVLFPITDGQDCVLHIGVKSRETRGVEIKGVQIIQNNMTYNTGKFAAATAGAKTGLFMETVVFSEISDLVLTGTNVDAEYGISFNGCETPFRRIRFRRWGAIGSNAKCAFYCYNRKASDGSKAMVVSGMTFENIDFEGVGVTHFQIDGTDIHFTNSCNELGSVKTCDGHTYTAVNYEDIPSGATINNKGIFNIGPYTLGAQFDEISIQKLGRSYKHTYTGADGNEVVEYDVWDNLFTQNNNYLNCVFFMYDNILLQECKKDINIVNFPSKVDISNLPNKGVIGAGKVVMSNYSGKIILRDNMGVQLSNHRNTIPHTNGKISLGNFKSVFQNNTLYPNDSILQHGVFWDSDRQLEYMRNFVCTSYTHTYSNYQAIFLVDENLLVGDHTIYIKYANPYNNSRDIKMTITFSDGTTRVETINMPGLFKGPLDVVKYTFNQSIKKRMIKIEIGGTVASGINIYSITHKL